jgi:hypothetical protein
MATHSDERKAMNADETYQGRTNMETWDIAAVSDNDRPLYNAVTRIVAANPEVTVDLADALKEFFERKVEDSPTFPTLA